MRLAVKGPPIQVRAGSLAKFFRAFGVYHAALLRNVRLGLKVHIGDFKEYQRFAGVHIDPRIETAVGTGQSAMNLFKVERGLGAAEAYKRVPTSDRRNWPGGALAHLDAFANQYGMSSSTLQRWIRRSKLLK